MRSLMALLLVAVVLVMLECPALATTSDVSVVGTSAAVTLGSFLYGGWFGVAVGGLVSAAGEGYYYYCVATTGAGDPPDLVNYASRADVPLLLPSYTRDPGTPDALHLAVVDVFESMSQVVRDCKSIRQTRDRLAGAEMVGSETDIANQQQWLQEFTNDLYHHNCLAHTRILAYTSLLQINFPDIYSMTIPVADIKAMRDQEAAGIFPTLEQQVFADWQLTSAEISEISSCIARVSDEAIEGVGPLTFGCALETSVGTCCTPEPSGLLVISMLVGALGYLRVRRTLSQRR